MATSTSRSQIIRMITNRILLEGPQKRSTHRDSSTPIFNDQYKLMTQSFYVFTLCSGSSRGGRSALLLEQEEQAQCTTNTAHIIDVRSFLLCCGQNGIICIVERETW